MDFLYAAEGASQKSIRDAVVKLNEENRQTPSRRTTESGVNLEEVWQALCLADMERVDESRCDELLQL